MSLELVPVTLKEGRRFIGEHHRHNANAQPITWKFGVGVESDGVLVGVAMAGLPVARMINDRFTIEVSRTCTDGTPNANSMLYGAIARAAKALGYRRLITYTLSEEPGTSLKAAGWIVDPDGAESNPRWQHRAKHASYEMDLFGNRRLPAGPKVRWLREVV